jgi:hypothetical protein
MKRKFVATLIVALAVLFGQGGGLVLSVICPHLRSQERDNSCHTKSKEAGAEHHQPAEFEGHAFETEDPGGVRCNHCVVHSRNKREESALLQTNTQQRSDDHKVAVSLYNVESPPFLKLIARSAQAQGPPGHAAPLHVLINVFRI